MGARSNTPFQASLFDEADAGDVAALVTVAAVKARLTPTQRTFNQLIEKIRREREGLALWEACEEQYARRVAAELTPAVQQIREAQRRLVAELDRLLRCGNGGKRLAKRQRARARAYITEVINDILTDGPDAELEALHDEYSEISHAERQRGEFALAEALIGGLVGDEMLVGHGASDVDELFDFAAAKLAEQVQAEERERAARASKRRARRGGAANGATSAQRSGQAESDPKQSVREIFRKLASALHPDRERDAAERERKTQLMQRVNQAYEKSDLLELLTLQIEIEQIDANHFAEVPEERLRRYNDVLREQVRALKDELQQRMACFRLELNLPPFTSVNPRMVDQALSARLLEVHALRRDIEQDIEGLANPLTCGAVLKALDHVEEDAPAMAWFDPALMTAMAQWPSSSPPPRERGGKQGRSGRRKRRSRR